MVRATFSRWTNRVFRRLDHADLSRIMECSYTIPEKHLVKRLVNPCQCNLFLSKGFAQVCARTIPVPPSQ